MNTREIFSQRVKQLRLASGLSQQKVADALGIAKGSYQGYELKGITPSFDTIPKLAVLFNVSADYLLGLSDAPSLLHMDEETKILFLALRALKGNAGAAQ